MRKLAWGWAALFGLAVACEQSEGGRLDSAAPNDVEDPAEVITNAGAGGDPVTGGAGGDPVTGGAGGDPVTGGAGGDNSAGDGSAGDGKADITLASAPVDGAEIVLLPIEDRPYTECDAWTIGSEYQQDDEGIPLKVYGGSPYYNPVMIAQAGLVWLACHRQTSEAWYLEQARKAARKLVQLSEKFDGAMFFPYPIDYTIHGNKKEVARAPWYSGMAQGQALSVFSRLGELTSEPEWEAAAEATLKSFDRAHGEAEPWIIELQADNSVWIEEYANTPETHVLNGFMFAMFGLYDYYAWRGDAHAAFRFLQSLYTLRGSVERFQNPGGLSSYCLAHHNHSVFYHGTHIWQLRAVSRMVDDPYFASVADLFATDYAP